MGATIPEVSSSSPPPSIEKLDPDTKYSEERDISLNPITELNKLWTTGMEKFKTMTSSFFTKHTIATKVLVSGPLLLLLLPIFLLLLVTIVVVAGIFVLVFLSSTALIFILTLTFFILMLLVILFYIITR